MTTATRIQRRPGIQPLLYVREHRFQLILVFALSVMASARAQQPIQACCRPDGICVDTDHMTCVMGGGHPLGGMNCQNPAAVCHPIKWSQPPLLDPASPMPDCFFGWDQASHYQCCQILADDFVCSGAEPITDVHWWGSYQGWDGPVPPPQPSRPAAFHIGIWTDIPAGPSLDVNCCHCWDDPPGLRNDCSQGPFDFNTCMLMGQGYSHCEYHPQAVCANPPQWICEPLQQPFSHPGRMIWEWVVPIDALNERMVGCDFTTVGPYPMQVPETCFKYDFVIPEGQWFYQGPATPTIYWLSVAAVYPVGTPSQFPWGWKTRTRDPASPAPDDAVVILQPLAPTLGAEYGAGYALKDQLGRSVDAAFVLTGAGFTDCHPDAGGTQCQLALCQDPLEVCVPQAVRCDATGLCQIVFCDCQRGDLCHVDLTPGSAQPYCVGSCPPGEDCMMISTVEPDGSSIAKCICVEQPQACCFVDGHCEMRLPTDCLVVDGTPQGPGSVCTVPEACCLPGGVCAMVDPLCCDDLGGASQGAGTVCSQTPIACCLQDGSGGCLNTDPICCDDVGGQPSPVGAAMCLGDANGNGVDDACEAPKVQACCLPNGVCVELEHSACVQRGGDPQGPNTICDMRICPASKWSQPPTFGPAGPQAACFWGWDEFSHYQCCQVVADDWLCQTDQPITDIHWWGSYGLWEGQEPPPDAPPQFHIGIWTDVPRGADPEHPFSHPGIMIHQWIVPRLSPMLTEKWVGCDQYPDRPRESCFRYDFTIPQNEWFYQNAASVSAVYWISISADYLGPPLMHPWGWKTREHFFNDDAVRIMLPNAPLPGMPFMEGEPIEEPGGVSWDMAFVLTTRTPSRSKWDQWPSTHLPGLHAHDGITLADNWECHGGMVTDLHWWGNYELDMFGNERRGSGVDVFRISIHTNHPDLPWCLPQDPELWGFSLFFSSAHEADTGLVNNEGSKIYRYDFAWWPGFPQVAGEIYWLDIEAISRVNSDPALWRWQESSRDAIPRLCPAAERTPSMAWHSIQWNTIPLTYTDLAFRVTSTPVAPPDPDPSHPNKNRYISFVPGGAGEQTALRVRLVDLDRFPAWEGESRWVGEPRTYQEGSAPTPTFKGAKLACSPHFMDWGAVGLVHVTGAEVVPRSVYEVQSVSVTCPDLSNEECYSAPLRIGTQKWGDTVSPFALEGAGSQPNFLDISAIVDKFQGRPGAIIKARAQLQPNVPNPANLITFLDISQCVDAFKGKPYSFSGPCVCPSTAMCPTLDACERCTP